MPEYPHSIDVPLQADGKAFGWNCMYVRAEDPFNPGTYMWAPFSYEIRCYTDCEANIWPPNGDLFRRVVAQGGAGCMFVVTPSETRWDIIHAIKIDTHPGDPWCLESIHAFGGHPWPPGGHADSALCFGLAPQD
jgi:hypothetical protein